ncbi:uncharacterized protein LOC111881562 isoform X5 [Lactuca sativa]|uniref:uncharacterized protein LOC111881562 isoform X5 n=1 Tax=Lactuca sativa TaxID=4236 RepID=UPI001C68E68B|nr:uncharacterized protein LOC111881562 isoform X5 [Lactuca sativa]
MDEIAYRVQSLLYWIFGTRIVLYVNDIAMIRLFYRENRDNTGLFLRFSSCQPFLQMTFLLLMKSKKTVEGWGKYEDVLSVFIVDCIALSFKTTWI